MKHVVYAVSGEYDSRETQLLFVFDTPEDAEAHRVQLEAWAYEALLHADQEDVPRPRWVDSIQELRDRTGVPDLRVAYPGLRIRAVAVRELFDGPEALAQTSEL